MNINLCILIIVIVLLIFWCISTQTSTFSGYEFSANEPVFVCCQYTPTSGPDKYFWWHRKDCQPDDIPRKNFKIMPGIKSKSACEAWNNKV